MKIFNSNIKNNIVNSRLMKRLSSGYYVGPNVSDAINACKRIAKYGVSTTICPWHSTDDSSEFVTSKYLNTLKSLVNENLDCYLSIKPWAIKYDFGLLKDILDIAKNANIRIHFDSLDMDSSTYTFDLMEKAILHHQNVSYTLPGRWKRSIKDAERIIELGIPARVVKGESIDTNNPEINLQKGFYNVINILAGRGTHVDVATHDLYLARISLELLKKTETSCNLELLYGLPLRSVKIAQNLEIPIRIYIPYGNSFIDYGLKKIISRPIAITWMIKDLIMGNKFRLSKLEYYM